MGKDKRGVNRGSCQKCDCKEYEVFDKRLLCDYCGHRPVDHEVLKDDERPKRKCTPKKDVSPKKRKITEKKGSPLALVRVEPLQTAGGKRIMSVSTGPVTRRRRPMSEDNADDNNDADAKESAGESEKEIVKRTKPNETKGTASKEFTAVSKEEVMDTEAENVEEMVSQARVDTRTDVVVEVELDQDNREVFKKETPEEAEEELESDVVVNSKETSETTTASIAASRSRRSTAGLKLSKLVQKERDSDESTDEESEEVEEVNADLDLFPHRCPKCGKRFKLLSNLAKHRKEHAQQKYNQRKYICGICNARFLTHTDLKSHLRTHTSPLKPLACEDCGKEYKDELALNAHKKIHMADHLYACNVCYKTFTRRHDLKRHQASVHEDYHYVCGVCGLMYKSRKTLTNHEVIHQNDNSHVEDTSVVESSEETAPEDNAVLVASTEEDVIKLEDGEERPERPKRRSYTARGDRIFDCLLCVKSYTTKDQLRQHILAHAGKYQYVCDFCGQGFLAPKLLKDHIFKAHGDTEGREFSCTECCCCFRTEEELLKHGEWHGEKGSRVIISNKKLVQLIQKLDSSTTEDFMTNRSFWAESDEKDDDVLEDETMMPGDQDNEADQLTNESNENEEKIQEEVKDEVKIQIELDTSHEDIDDAEADKLLFGSAKEEKVAKPFTCKICLKAFVEKMYCRCHVLAHVGVFRHQCKNCGVGFLKNSDLKRHGIRCKKKSRKHKTVAMHCNDCLLMFDNQIDYMQHRREVCSKTWIELLMRDENTETVNEEEDLNLERLKEKIKIQPESLINAHEGITNSGKPLRTCIAEGCIMQFQNRPQLKQHLKHAHGIVLGAVPRKGEKKSQEPRIYKEGLLCTICGGKFKSSVQLTDHRATMHGEKGYSCSICGKAFGRKYDCQRHEENVHYGVNSKHCDICGKVCKDKYTVQIHKKVVHEQIKEHVCPQCGHKFSQRSNLNNHMRTHTQEKPYQCQECLKWFSTRQYRDMHMRIHTGERPHKCTYCSRTFSHPASLKYHIRTHEDDRPYPCLTCPRKFRDPSKRTKHIKTCPGEQSMIITRSIPGQTVITSEEDGQVTLQLEQSVINNLLLNQETTQIQIQHDDTIEDEHVQQIEQLIQENQIQLEDEGTQVLVLDQGASGDAETVYLLVPSDTVSVE